jgi:CheY-like chemotaxis protein
MSRVLQSCGLKTVHAENGLEALEKIDDDQHFDLIIMDWDMPKLNGLDTARAIRLREQKSGQPAIPIMAFTDHREPSHREACLQAGMNAYLPKDVFMPNWRSILIDNLQGVISGHFSLSDFNGSMQNTDSEMRIKNYDYDAFDHEIFEQTALLLKDELEIAIQEYLEDTVSYMRQIEGGIHSNNMADIALGSHPLKSNSKGFGLSAVAEIADAINISCEQAENHDKAIKISRVLFSRLQKAFSIGEKSLVQATKNFIK